MVASIGGYGTLADEQFRYKEADLQEEARRIGIPLVDEVGRVKEGAYRETVVRKVSEEPYWKIRYKGDCREIFFLTSLSRTPEFIAVARDMAEKSGFDAASIGVYVQQVLQGTACHCEFDLFVGERDAAQIKEFYTSLSTRISELGGYFSRPYGIWSDIVYPHCETFVKYARGLKKIFDPNLIMNPEKICFKGMAHES
jgi:FAD/FMN-containing dehydrogenase